MRRFIPILVISIMNVSAALADVASSDQAPSLRSELSRWTSAAETEATKFDGIRRHDGATIGRGSVLLRGAKGDRVRKLSERLVEEGALSPQAVGSVLDERIESALVAWQERNGLTPDGKAGDEAVEILDRQPDEAAANLRAAAKEMEAFSSGAVPDDVVIVNLASQQLLLVRGGRIVLSMRTAVGRPSRPTPAMNDRIVGVVFNPTWTVPPTVMKKDKLPSLQRRGTPGISGAAIYVDGELVDPKDVDWKGVSPGRIRIVQAPGDHNALGRIKFELTNGDNIYMHDTNDHSVFGRTNRMVSSGCVRLADPMALAVAALSPQGWDEGRIRKAIDARSTARVGLSSPLPVRLVYWTAALGADGAVSPARDAYGRNRIRSASMETTDGSPR